MDQIQDLLMNTSPPPQKKKKLPSLVDCVLKNYPPKKLNKHTDMINSSIVFVLDCITNLLMQITIEYYFPKLPEKIQKIIYSSIVLVTAHLKKPFPQKIPIKFLNKYCPSTSPGTISKNFIPKSVL